MSKLPIIGISMGDVNGIGPEVVIKTLYDNRISDYCTPVIYGSSKVITYWKKVLALNDFNINIIKSIDQIHTKKSNIFQELTKKTSSRVMKYQFQGREY